MIARNGPGGEKSPPPVVSPIHTHEGRQQTYAYLLDYRLEIGDEIGRLLHSGHWRNNGLTALRFLRLLTADSVTRELLGRIGYRPRKHSGTPKISALVEVIEQWRKQQ